MAPALLNPFMRKPWVLELKKRGIGVAAQVEITITYDEVEIGRHRLDLLVEDTIVVDLKAIKNLEDVHFAIVRSQLRAIGKKHGLLLNFAKVTLEVKRVITSCWPLFLPSLLPEFLRSRSTLRNAGSEETRKRTT